MKQSRKSNFLLITIAANLSASLMMAFVLGPATIAGGEAEVRMHYIHDNKVFVQIGWASWILASLSLVLFFQIMYEVISASKTMLLLALLISVIGAASDTISDMISLGMMPFLAEEFLSATDTLRKTVLLHQFHTFDRLSVFLTGGLGNTCYGISGILLTYVFFRNRIFTPFIRFFSLPLWTFTFFMSYGSFNMNQETLPYAVGITMFLFIVWVVLIYFELRKSESQESSL
ncbi:MAG: hypothetical protein OEZ34_07695 [Spirochaetia bacterium]|nr:hypothetical protein [Spirochaetia bacterium]